MQRRGDLVRIDEGGVATPLDRASVARLRAARGTFRLVPSPPRVLLLKRDADGDDPVRVRLAGEISTPGALCDIVALIAQASFHGELVVLGDGPEHDVAKASRSIFFDGGNVVGALSTASGERLGEIMYRLGALDREQVAAVSRKATPARRFGETAVDLGFLARSRLFELVRAQIEEIVYSALRVADGTFWFLDGFDPLRLGHRHAVSAQALLMEGVRRMDEARYFRERIPSPAHVALRLPSRVDPPAELVDVFRACDGHRSVLDVGRACGRSELDVTHALFRLSQAGFVQICPPSPDDPEAIVTLFNEAMRTIVAEADAAGRGRPLRDRLAAFASSTGVYDALFLGAGPRADGTLDARRVAANLGALAGDDPAAALSQWLYEYASYAVFDLGSELPRPRAQALGGAVADRIARLAPKNAPPSVLPPPTSSRPASRAPTQTSAAPPAVPARPKPPSPPPKPNLPALAPLPTPPPDTRPSAHGPPPPPRAAPASAALPPMLETMFEDDAEPASPATPAPAQPARAAPDPSLAARARTRRIVRSVLLATALLLLAGAGVGTLFVTGVVSLPTATTDEPPPKTSSPEKKRAPKSQPSPQPSLSAAAAASSANAEAPAASVSAAPSAPAPTPVAPAIPAIPPGKGLLRTSKAPAGFRVFVDGKVMGNTPEAFLVPCGARTVKVGSHGTPQTIGVPCGGELEVYAK